MAVQKTPPMTPAERKRRSRARGKGRQRGGGTKAHRQAAAILITEVHLATAAMEVYQPLTRSQMAAITSVPTLYEKLARVLGAVDMPPAPLELPDEPTQLFCTD